MDVTTAIEYAVHASMVLTFVRSMVLDSPVPLRLLGCQLALAFFLHGL